MSKSESDFQAICRILDTNIQGFWSGNKDTYRVVATQLRILLCDRNPLLSRVRPDVRLHKLHWTEVLENCPSLANGLEIMMPGKLSMNRDGTSYFELSFAKSKTMLNMKHWVSQPFINPQITVWHFIKSVADKEASHSDPDYDETLVRAKLVKYMEDESHLPCTIAIGEYLVRWLRDSGEIA